MLAPRIDDEVANTNFWDRWSDCCPGREGLEAYSGGLYDEVINTSNYGSICGAAPRDLRASQSSTQLAQETTYIAILLSAAKLFQYDPYLRLSLELARVGSTRLELWPM
jgi:hypothetical protein